MSKMTVTFEVHNEDLTSERRLEYRQAMIDAMSKYFDEVKSAVDVHGTDTIPADVLQNAELIDKMLNDCNR